MTQVPLPKHNDVVQTLPSGSSRSVVRHSRSAKASVQRLGDRECQAIRYDECMGFRSRQAAGTKRLGLQTGPSRQCRPHDCVEMSPTLRWRSARPDHVLGDAALTDVDPEFDKLTMNPRRAPQWIGDAYLAYQLANFDRYCRAAGPASRLPAPVRSKARAVPTQYGIGANNRKRLSGIRKQLENPAEQPPVCGQEGQSG